MLFCSLVAVDGSVMPGGGASEKAAWDVCGRPLKRSISVTIPAANNPEITAINKTWRVESLYIKLLLSLDSESSLFSRCRHGARMPFNRMPVVCCRVELCLIKQRNERVGKAADVVEHEHGFLPAEGQTGGCCVNEHQAEVDTERDCQTASGERQMAATIEN